MMEIPFIKSCLWFDHQAEEAVGFYTSVLKNSETGAIARYTWDNGTLLEGSVLTISFRLAGHEFVALNGGPYFSFTPATSFFVGCESVEEFDKLWEKLSDGGNVLMEAEAMPPFFEKFGWLQDKYGLSWQLGICGILQYITPNLLFVGNQYGRAEEAIHFYQSVFDTSSVEHIVRYDQVEGEQDGMVQHASFSLNGQAFMASESGWDHKFTFTEAVSFCIYCRTQAEIDKYWDALSAGGEEQPCGWLKDKFGVSWQLVPIDIEEMMTSGDTDRVKRMSEALSNMTKLDVEALRKAFEQ